MSVEAYYLGVLRNLKMSDKTWNVYTVGMTELFNL
jgi:hypothetical protein